MVGLCWPSLLINLMHRSILGFATASAALVAASVVAASPAHAVSATFNFSTDPEENFSSKLFTSGDFTTNVSSPVTGSFVPTNGGLNASSQGLCAWALVGTTGGRCGYNTIDGATSGDGLTGFTLSFNRSVFIDSFDISQFAPVTASGTTLTFTSGSSSEAFVITGANSSYSFLNSFKVAAGSDVFVTSTGTSSTANGGTFRIQSLDVTDVPGPIPFLGLGAAFTFSRKLKKKVNQSTF
jgi:hypothetical protein